MVPKNCPFDEKLYIWGNGVPEDVRDASTWVNDTIDLSWVSACQIFGDKATPELALLIYDRISLRIKEQSMSNLIND